MAYICWSNTRATECWKRCSWRSSWANALITRTPDTFSSASAVNSAIRCWASCSAGRERRPYIHAITITNGTGESDSAASAGWSANIATAASAIVNTDCAMKISPYPRKNRTDCRSTVARDISCPVCWRSKNASSSD